VIAVTLDEVKNAGRFAWRPVKADGPLADFFPAGTTVGSFYYIDGAIFWNYGLRDGAGDPVLGCAVSIPQDGWLPSDGSDCPLCK